MLSAAQLLVVLDSVIVNLALPAIKRDLNFDGPSLQWVLTAYILTFGGFLMVGGRVADLFGRRRVLISGIAVFSLSSLLIGFTVSGIMLILMRAVEGLAAAFMSPAALSILLTAFREGDERNRALSVWGVVISGGAAVGVILGGLLTQYFGWRWNFFINVPIGFLSILGIYKWVPAHVREASKPHLDLPGAILVTGGLVALVYALTLASRLGWTDSSTLLSLAISLILLVGFIYNESRVKFPLAPLSIFRNRSVSGGNLIMLLVVGGSIGVGYFSSLYVQNVLHYSPAQSGLSFLPIPIIIGLISTRAPRLLSRFGVKQLLVVGIALMALSVFLLSLSNTASTYVTHLLPAFLILAIGDGFAFVAGTVAATSGVRAEESGLASGLVNTAEQVGGALGLAILVWVAASVTASSVAIGQDVLQANMHGYQAAFLVSAGMLIAALGTTIIVIREPESEGCRDCPEGRSFEMD